MTAPAAAPLGELRSLASHGETGEFICATSAAEIHVYLQRGRVAWATTSSHPLEFARYIKKNGRIDDKTFKQVVEECRRERLPLGETLVAWGLVGWDEVREALRHQITQALGELAEVASARTMFLERKRFAEYDVELTVDLTQAVPAPSVRPEPPRSSMRPSAPDCGFACQLLDTVEGAAWVELLEGERLLESAPDLGGGPRIPAELVRTTLGDGADFVAIRAARGSIVGARLSREKRSLWCALAADSTFGAAVSTLWSLSGLQPWGNDKQPPSGEAGWELGASASEEANEIRLVLERAREVVAAVVLSGDGDPVVGVARGGLAKDRCLELLRRRARIFDAPVFQGDDREELGPDSGPRLATLGFTFRTLVTGERGLWCFGAELMAARQQTLWILTDRSAAQGLGWACLSALGRCLSRLRVAPEAARAL